MTGNEGLTVADAIALRNDDGSNAFGGGNGAWWLIILMLFFGMGGRGRVDYRYMTDRPYDDYSYGRRGGYRGNDRFREHLNRVIDGADMYEYGRERYMEGGSEERIYDGLEKLMYAVCTFVESTMDFAESAEEKEIIRKHIQKLKNI